MDNIKVDKIYEFLLQNRQYNKAVQKAWYNSVILPYNIPQDKITALLHHIVNTQSQPKIDKTAIFFMEVNKHKSMLKHLMDL